MKKISVLLIMLVTLVSCGNQGNVNDTVYDNETETMVKEEVKAVSKKISAEEAKKMMDEGGVRIIDVREPSEYADGHVPGAELLPLGDIKSGQLSTIGDKDEVILLYCRSGNRSGQAASYLVDQGYTNIYDFGGIVDWPFEVE